MSEDNLKQKKIDFDAQIPEAKKVRIEIMSPKPRMPVRAIILSRRPYSVMTHFYKQRTVRCTIETGQCEAHDHTDQRFKMYLAGWSMGQRQRQVLIEITHHAAADNAHVLDKGGPNLRGWDISMRRKNNSNNSPVILEFSNPMNRRMDEVPEEFDVEEALLRIWNAPARKQRKARMAEEIRLATPRQDDNDIPV